MFEHMLGMKAKNIIGKTVIDIIPGIEKDPVDWIGKYGKVALSGEQLVFEDYSVIIDKWFRITAYSPKKNFFATTFTAEFWLWLFVCRMSAFRAETGIWREIFVAVSTLLQHKYLVAALGAKARGL